MGSEKRARFSPRPQLAEAADRGSATSRQILKVERTITTKDGVEIFYKDGQRFNLDARGRDQRGTRAFPGLARDEMAEG
jgi:hypothetical protein